MPIENQWFGEVDAYEVLMKYLKITPSATIQIEVAEAFVINAFYKKNECLTSRLAA